MLLLARWMKAGRDLDDWLESMRVQLHHEIDYLREAELHGRMRDLAATAPAEQALLGVPALYPRYCSPTLLAMDYVDGLAITDNRIARLSLARRNSLAKSMLELFFYELYEWGLLQTDPNFGNYLVRPNALPASPGNRAPRDELVLLDFGSILDCDVDFLFSLRSAIAAGQDGDSQALADALEGLGCLHSDSTVEARESFSSFCMQLLEPLRPPADLPAAYLNSKGEYCWARSRLMQRVGKQAAASAVTRHFAPPSREFALIARKLTGVFTFVSVLEAEFNAHEIVAAHIGRWHSGLEPGIDDGRR
jgi:hypothetical protein